MMNSKACQLIDELTQGQQGFTSSKLPGVSLFRSPCSTPKTLFRYKLGLIIIIQGQKLVHFNNRKFLYNANNYLLLAAPLLLHCETTALNNNPVLGLYIDLDITLIQSICNQLDPLTLKKGLAGVAQAEIASAVPLELDMQEIVIRLLSSLKSSEKARVLGTLHLTELFYCLLIKQHSSPLFALVDKRNTLGKIASIMSEISENPAKPFCVSTAAAKLAMSKPTFHRKFKAVTGQSPLKYCKNIRLNYSKELILRKNKKISEIANEVGYESFSQFSREFKRLFGVSPKECSTINFSTLW